MLMNTYISLLRGVNPGKRNKVPMAALQVMYQTLEGIHVTIYIQSENVIFQSADSAPKIREKY